MTRKNLKSKKHSSKTNNNSVTTLLKQIQLNTATNIAQVVPDTVVFPILKRSRPYSAVLSFNDYFVNSTTVPVTYSKPIALSNLAGYTDYTSAFDKYRILEVQVEFIPNNQGVVTTSSNLISTVIDYDDATALTTGSEYEYDSCYTCNSNQNFKRTFIPRLALAAYSGAFSSYAEAKAGQWIDCASASVQHFALKCIIYPSTPAFAYQLVYRVHVQFALQH
jgi:hypothetical protein